MSVSVEEKVWEEVGVSMHLITRVNLPSAPPFPASGMAPALYFRRPRQPGRVWFSLGQDSEEQLCFGGIFQVEVVFADDALGIAGLEGGFADGAKLRDEHRNIRVPHHVVGQVELFDGLFAQVLEVGWDDRILLQRVGAQPCRQVWLDRDRARLADL